MKDSVYAYILAAEIKYPEIVLRQAILETGWFTSSLLMNRNNLFAFRATKKYMRFDTWQKSVEYYKKWQLDNYTNSKENYYSFLRRKRYARHPDYIKALKGIRLTRSEGAQQVSKPKLTKKQVSP